MASGGIYGCCKEAYRFPHNYYLSLYTPLLALFCCSFTTNKASFKY